MNYNSSNSLNKSQNKFIWEGAIPNYLKNPQRPVKSASHLGRRGSLSKQSTSFIKEPNHKDVSIISSQNYNSSPSYTIKYLGITKGQIGILSKRTPIPCLSHLETCKDVPLSLINSSINNQRTSSRLLSRLVTLPEKSILIKPEVPETFIEKPEEEEDFPNPEAYNEFVIHTYARPRALIAVKKENTRDFPQHKYKPVKLPNHRVGISGWKLSRPKTSNATTDFDKRIKRSATKKTENKIQKPELPDFYNEPYLKFIADKRKSNV
jgi:hypothetical protein